MVRKAAILLAILLLVSKSHSGNISDSDVTSTNGLLEGFRGAATQGGAGFTDNTNANIS